MDPVELAVDQELRGPARLRHLPWTVEDHQLPELIGMLVRRLRVERMDRLHQPIGLVLGLLQHAQEPLVVGIQQLVTREDEATAEEHELADRRTEEILVLVPDGLLRVPVPGLDLCEEPAQTVDLALDRVALDSREALGVVNASDESARSHWLDSDCGSANGFCDGADLTYSGGVDIADLILFLEHWTRTAGYEPTFSDLVINNTINTDDLAALMDHWLDTGCDETNQYCGGADIDHTGSVDFIDYSLLSNNWLISY